MRSGFLSLILTILGFACAVLPGRGMDMGPTVVQPGVFSYQAPKNWTVQDTPLSKYKVAVGARSLGFVANINVVIEANPKSLRDYVATDVAAMKASSQFQVFRVISQKSFATSAGLDGIRLEVADRVNNFDLQQIFYFFDGGSGNKLVVTTSCLASDGAFDAILFDASLKTLTLE